MVPWNRLYMQSVSTAVSHHRSNTKRITVKLWNNLQVTLMCFCSVDTHVSMSVLCVCVLQGSGHDWWGLQQQQQ